ncbi:hypothetical protein IWX81_002552 [Salinibacterium sp. CAN_S4]|uniref:DUF4082 domain-containing protein n=1 Tax=Salinibacterium sp. CAN_S4 TaxID=2787727 RepID=UPI0018EFA1E5
MSSQNPGQRAQIRRRNRLKRRWFRGGFASLGVMALAVGTAVAIPAFAQTPATATSSMRPATSTTGIFSDSLKPSVAVDPDRDPVELGLKFSPEKSGSVTALQYFQSRAASGVTSATLWTADGKKLATASFSATTREGWRTIMLTTPAALEAGRSYVVSYFAPQGSYAVSERDLTSKKSLNGFTISRGAGVYKYGQGGFPTNSYNASNYFVDVVFAPGTTVGSTPATPPRSPGTTAPATPSPSPVATRPPVLRPMPAPVPIMTPPATPAPSPTPSPAPAPPPAPSPAPAPTAPGTAGWTVSASTVGLAPLGLTCASLPAYTGSSSVPSGSVISGKRISGGLDLSAGSITIENSCIQPTSAGRGMPVVATQNFNTFAIAPSKVTIRNSEFDGSRLPTQDAAWATAFIGIADLTGNYIHGFGSGIGIMNSGSSLDATIERNYVTGLVAWGNPATNGNHSDAFTVRDFTDRSRADRKLTVLNNRFNSNSGSDTGALFIQTYSGSIDNVLIQGNLLEGNGYQLGLNQMNDSYSNLRAVNNRFSGTGFGATYVQNGPGWAQWDSNFIYSSSATECKGAAVRQP